MCELCGIRPETESETRARAEAYRKEHEDRQKAEDLMKIANERRDWKLLGAGCFRQTYLSPSGKFVYKVPVDQFGFLSNRREHDLYRDPSRDTASGLGRDKLARCRLSPSGVLVMELVKPSVACHKRYGSPSIEEEPPVWSDAIDSAQVGKARDGEWKVFDYGNE